MSQYRNLSADILVVRPDYPYRKKRILPIYYIIRTLSAGEIFIKRHAVILLFFVLAACEDAKKPDASTIPRPTTGLVEVSKVYPSVDGATWVTPVDTGRYFVRTLTPVFEGKCPSGAKKVIVKKAGVAYAEQGTCTAPFTFSWTRTFLVADEGPLDLTLIALDAAGAEMAATSIPLLINLDATDPASPTPTLPATTPYTIPAGPEYYDITGAVPTGAVKILGPGGIEVPIVSNTWTYRVTLGFSGNGTFDFKAVDFSGNKSPVFTQSLLWTYSTVQLVMGETSFGRKTTVGTTVLEGSVTFEGGQISNALDGSGTSILSGINLATKALR